MPTKASRLHKLFCARLLETRRELGLTQAEVARRMKCHQTTYAQIETGRRIPQLDTIEAAAKALDVDVVDLLQSRVTA